MYVAAAIIFCSALRSLGDSRDVSAVSTVGEKRRIFACRATTLAGGCCTVSAFRGFLVCATNADTITENTNDIKRPCFNKFIVNPSRDLHSYAGVCADFQIDDKWIMEMIYGKAVYPR